MVPLLKSLPFPHSFTTNTFTVPTHLLFKGGRECGRTLVLVVVVVVDLSLAKSPPLPPYSLVHRAFAGGGPKRRSETTANSQWPAPPPLLWATEGKGALSPAARKEEEEEGALTLLKTRERETPLISPRGLV